MLKKEPGFPDRSGFGMPPKLPRRVIGLAVCLIVGLIVLSQTFVIVQAGERAVIFSDLSGVQTYQLSEGFHLNLPLVWHITKYDIKTRTYTMSGSTQESNRSAEARSDSEQVPDDSLIALTSDGLPVTLDLSIRFHIDPDNVWQLHRQIGPEFIDRVVRPQARSIARMTFAGFPVIDVYSGKRQAIVDSISTQLREKFRQNYLVLDEVLLRDIRFPAEFQATIEQKQVAQQAAEQMVYELQRAELEKQQKIVQAQGEAAAIRKTADALNKNPQLIQYEYVQRLPADTRVMVTDGKTIVSMGDAFNETPTQATREGKQ
jgi:prohibitin 2